jgi:murein L,D-transpeptidase YafK
LIPGSFARALFASAAIAAAIVLSGCDEESVIPTGRALAPLSDKMVKDIADKNMDKESPILIRLFKEEAELEVWKATRDGNYALLKTYPICRWSGDLGPKKREGDRQAPEGFYTITPGQMNPNSNYYLAFNTGFPNAYDRSWGYTGSELMVHGDCSSRGCYAMTDEQIQEIYGLARDSFFGGQKDFQFEAFPFRMTALNMAKHRNNPNFAFWKMLKEGYDHFEATKQEPKVAVCERHYVFDPQAADGSSKPLHFDPRGKCPAYQLDKNIAAAVIDTQHHEETQMASYIADNVSLAPPHVGDGGMNPVFAAKLATHNEFDANGRTYVASGNDVAPGALPHVPNAPGAFAALHPPPKPAKQPAPVTAVATTAAPPDDSASVQLASVPVPQPAPLPKEGEAPEQQSQSLAGLFGNLFGGKAQAAPAEPAPVAQTDTASDDTEPVALRGTTSVAAAKPKAAPAYRTASAPPVPLASKPAPKAVAAAPAPKPPVQQAQAKPAKPETQAAQTSNEIRTAYSAPPPQQQNTNGLLAGAQPVVPAGTFENRWSAFR